MNGRAVAFEFGAQHVVRASSAGSFEDARVGVTANADCAAIWLGNFGAQTQREVALAGLTRRHCDGAIAVVFAAAGDRRPLAGGGDVARVA